MFAKFIGQIVGAILAAGILSLIIALFLQLGMKLVTTFKPSYGIAYNTSFVSMMAGGLIQLIIRGLSLLILGTEPSIAIRVLTGILTTYVTIVIYEAMLRNAEGNRIGMGKAFLVWLVQFAISLLIFGVLALPLVLLFGTGIFKGFQPPP
ncbi:MAG: hypothetical protein JW828_13790 [Sedimentisphaerales bacterium]|nr:hypothetical protein [Sedimentisphaerales bacterium]